MLLSILIFVQLYWGLAFLREFCKFLITQSTSVCLEWLQIGILISQTNVSNLFQGLYGSILEVLLVGHLCLVSFQWAIQS
jgi:hypothetical protein